MRSMQNHDMEGAVKDPERWLFLSLSKRHTPENVAHVIRLWKGLQFTASEAKVLYSVASDQPAWMPTEFRSPVKPDRQISVAQELFEKPYPKSTPSNDCPVSAMQDDVETLQGYLQVLLPTIKKVAGSNSFKYDRITRKEFKALKLSRRGYNKMFRFLVRLEKKVAKYGIEVRKYIAVLTSKAGQAHTVTYEEFSENKYAACFMAYYSARAKRRSVFTNKSQDKPFDTLSDTLLKKALEEGGHKAMLGVAKVMPHADVLDKLREEDKLSLLSASLWNLYELAAMLKSVWETSKFDREKMIVSRGDDSSTWNALAGAWNSCRSAWVALNYSLGLDSAVEKMCLGKVMRLMAADVAYWHRASGGDVDPDTKVWASLPAPWEVLVEGKDCTAKKVEAMCDKYKVDARKKGWISPPPDKRKVVEFKPTPNLVHGVAVSSPELAILLHKAGVFSGKAWSAGIKDMPSFTVERDIHGMALKAKPSKRK